MSKYEELKEKGLTDLKDIAGLIRQQLKKEFPDVTFSVQIQRYSMGQSMTISLMKAPFDAFDRQKDIDKSGNKIEYKGYAQLNQFTLRAEDGYSNGVYLTPKAQEALGRAYDLTNEYNWDNSDIQTDYFDVNFYVHMAIGKWDEPFRLNTDPAPVKEERPWYKDRAIVKWGEMGWKANFEIIQELGIAMNGRDYHWASFTKEEQKRLRSYLWQNRKSL